MSASNHRYPSEEDVRKRRYIYTAPTEDEDIGWYMSTILRKPFSTGARETLLEVARMARRRYETQQKMAVLAKNRLAELME